MLFRSGHTPTIGDMDAFFPLYLERKVSELRKNSLRTNLSGDDEDSVISDFLSTTPVFYDYEEFKKLAENWSKE